MVLEDSAGQVVTSESPVDVTILIAPGTGSPSAKLQLYPYAALRTQLTTTQTTLSGTATFPFLTISTIANGYQLSAVCNGTRSSSCNPALVSPATSAAFDVTPMSTRVDISGPDTIKAGVVISPAVRVTMVGSGVAAQYQGSTTIGLVFCPAASLSGTTNASFVNGVATFSNLTVNGPASKTCRFTQSAAPESITYIGPYLQ